MRGLVHACVYVRACVRACVCVCVCACVRVRACVCVLARAHVYGLCMSLRFIWLCVVRAFVCMRVFARVVMCGVSSRCDDRSTLTRARMSRLSCVTSVFYTMISMFVRFSDDLLFPDIESLLCH